MAEEEWSAPVMAWRPFGDQLAASSPTPVVQGDD
jgi:hypothetical protein